MKIEFEFTNEMIDKLFLEYLDNHINYLKADSDRILVSINNGTSTPASIEDLKDNYQYLTILNKTRTYFSVPGSYEEVYPIGPVS